jgi:hypothetical protein
MSLYRKPARHFHHFLYIGNCPKYVSFDSNKHRTWFDLVKEQSPAAFMNYSGEKCFVTAEYDGSNSNTAVVVRAVADIPAFREIVWYKCDNENDDSE